MTSLAWSGLGVLPGWNLSLLLLLAKATVILVAALGITLAMQKASATARHLVWLVSLGTLLLVPFLTAWSPLRLAILPAQLALPVPVSQEPAIAAASPNGAERFARQQQATHPNPRAQQAGDASARFAPLAFVAAMSGASLLLTIWGVVMLLVLLTLAWAGMSVRRIVRNARPLDSSDWLNPLFEIADRIGLDEAPRLLQSSDARMPFACGLVTPTIVLPADSEQWSLDRRRAVLLHELAHVRRHDLIGHTLGRLACAVYWFHPMVWSAARHLRSESERACDDLALACGTRATDYAEHLLDIVTSVRGDATPLVALAMARRKEFEGRMLAILDPDLRRSTPSRRQSAALIAALAILSLTVGSIAPVARTAEAAVIAAEQTGSVPHSIAAPQVAADPAPATYDRPISSTLRSPAYPDSGMRGVVSTSQRTSYRTSASTSTRQSTSQSTSTRASGVNVSTTTNSSADAAIAALAKAGTEFGLEVASSVVRELGQVDIKGLKGAKGAKGAKDPDDRPILLARVLKSDTSASLRRIAAWGLHEYADAPVASEALSNAVRHDSDWRVREMAAWALGEGDGGSSATGALLAALKGDANEHVRATAAWALGNKDDRSAVDGLGSALADPVADVRIRAAWAIGNVSPRVAPKSLVAMLGDKDPHARTVAAWALFNIGDASAAPAIESALKTEQDRDVQVALIRAVAVLGERSEDVLRGLLDSPDARVKSMAVHALAGGHAAGPWPWPWPQPRPFP